MAKGWICLHRKIQECDLWLDDEPFDRRSAWVDLLLSANHENKDMIFDGHKITIERGQLITSVRKLSIRWGWGKDKTLKFLKLLEELEMIEKNSDSRRTLLTIVNYDNYQSYDNEEQTLTRTVRRQYQDADADTDKPQTTNINNINNDNNENNNIADKQKHKYGEYNHVLLTDKQRDTLFDEYGEMETMEAIKYLDEYIEMKGYKAKNHYLCIRKWVFDALKKNGGNKNRKVDWDNI